MLAHFALFAHKIKIYSFLSQRGQFVCVCFHCINHTTVIQLFLMSLLIFKFIHLWPGGASAGWPWSPFEMTQYPCISSLMSGMTGLQVHFVNFFTQTQDQSFFLSSPIFFQGEMISPKYTMGGRVFLVLNCIVLNFKLPKWRQQILFLLTSKTFQHSVMFVSRNN